MDKYAGRLNYLKGLADGMNLREKGDEAKILADLIDILTDMSSDVDTLIQAQRELDEESDEVLDDLLFLESIFSEILGEDIDLDEIDSDDDVYEVTCPKCGCDYLAEFEDFDYDDVVCPNCGEPYHLDLSLLDDLTE